MPPGLLASFSTYFSVNMNTPSAAARGAKRRCLPLLALSLILLFSGLFRQAQAQAPADSVDLFLTTKMRQLRIPGLQLAVVRRGQVVKLAQ